MPITTFRGMKPFSQLMFSFFIIVVCFLFFMVLAIVIAIPVFGIEALSNLTNINNLVESETIRFLKYFQVMQSFGIFVVPPIIIAWLFTGNIAKYLLLNKKILSTSIFMVIILIVIANPSINYIGSINAEMTLPNWLSGLEDWMLTNEENAAKLTEAFLDVNTIGGLLFNLFMVALLPAVGEELLFRGVIQKILTKLTKSYHWGIWISAILFSALHMQFYGFLPRLMLGVMFGYLLVWSGSLWLPIIAHFINNGVAVVAMWFVKQGAIDQSIEEIGATPESLYLAIFSLVFSILLMWLIKRQPKKEELLTN